MRLGNFMQERKLRVKAGNPLVKQRKSTLVHSQVASPRTVSKYFAPASSRSSSGTFPMSSHTPVPLDEQLQANDLTHDITRLLG